MYLFNNTFGRALAGKLVMDANTTNTTDNNVYVRRHDADESTLLHSRADAVDRPRGVLSKSFDLQTLPRH